MKITTWNVNGLRAVLRKGSLQPVLDGADIVCLQEIKARPEQISEEHHQIFHPYHTHWNPAKRPGYSGVLSLTRHKPDDVQIGLGDERFDPEGRLILTCCPQFSLFNIYFPSGQRDYGRVRYKLDFYARLLELIDDLHHQGERLIVCGDFNTAHCEIDLRNPQQNQTTSGFLPEERVWIDEYLRHGLVDVYRWLYPERVQYTWWTYRAGARQRNIGWRLDYFLVSEALLDSVQDVVIHDHLLGSDHCPVSLILG